MEVPSKKLKFILKHKRVGMTIEMETGAVQNESGAAENDGKLTEELKRLPAKVANLKTKKPVLLADKNMVENEQSSREVVAASPINYHEELGVESDEELVHYKLTEFPYCWKLFVNNEPEISWSIKHFKRPDYYQKVLALGEYVMQLYVNPDSSKVRMRLSFYDKAVWVPKPSIIAVITATQADWVDTNVVERCISKSDDSNWRFDYKTTIINEEFYRGCDNLDIEIYIELPWTFREMQSKSGVLCWIIDDFHDTFGNENGFMKSLEFSAPPTSFRMHAELSSSKHDDWLILKVKVRDGEAVDWRTEDYLIVVTVLRPNCKENKKRMYTKMSRLREGASFMLGKLDDIVDVNDIFICKIKIIFG